VGGLVGVSLSALLSPADLDGYGWRIAFLLGAATLPFGLLIRRGLPETLHAPDAATQIAGTRKGLALLRDNRRIIILSLAALAAATTGSYVFNYMVTFAQSTLNVPPRITFLASALGNGAGVVALLWGGWLSDRIGRRPVMIWPNLVFLVLILPVFFWIIAARDALALIVGTTVLGFIRAMSGGALYAAMMETLPKRIRAGAFAIIYAVSIALFGGATQLVVTGLIKVTGNPMALAWYLFAATVVGQAALSLIRESAPAKTRPATVTAR
jgi:MFS family permease